MVEIRGYRVKGINLTVIQKYLATARKAVQQALEDEYHRMLSDEITAIVDDAAMLLAPRPAGTLLAAAERELAERIGRACMGLETEYNLEASVSVLTDGKDTFLILHATNADLIEAFEGSASGILDYKLERGPQSLSGIEEMETDIAKKWKSLRTTYGDNLKLTAQTAVLADTSALKTDTSKLEFADVRERVRDRARHSYTSRMLAQYAGGKEIPPHKLMRIYDQALATTITDEGEAEIEAMSMQLMSVLPTITVDLITRDLNAPVEG